MNNSETNRDIPKRQTPFFFTLKSLSNTQQLSFYFIEPVTQSQLVQSANGRRQRTENLIKIMLQAPNVTTKKTLGDRTYMCAAPKLWNSLPYHVRNKIYFSKFKILLKTHLFNLAFN